MCILIIYDYRLLDVNNKAIIQSKEEMFYIHLLFWLIIQTFF